MKTRFSNVSVISEGEAKGHGLWVDSTTLDGVLQLLEGRSLKSYLTHAGAPFDRLGDEIALLEGFRRVGARILADLTLLEAFTKNDPRTAETIAELAEKAPDALGLSVTGILAKEWPTKNGNNVPAEGAFENAPPPDALHALPSIRFKTIASCDFVSQPAANVGLFSALSAKLAERDTQLAALTAERDNLLREVARLQAPAEEINLLRGKVLALATRLEEAEKFDMRKAGAAPVALSFADPRTAHTALAAPPDDAPDHRKWEHYAALEKSSPAAAEAYRKAHLSSARR